MKRNKLLTIAAAMAAAFTTQQQVSARVPAENKQVYVNRDTRKKETPSVINEIGGLDLNLYRPCYSSPIWHGKSQRKNHRSFLSLKKRVNKRHKVK